MIAAQTPPSFPDRALKSKAVLYSPLQDIDIYVEDEGSEVFYNELLKRLIGANARIASVIPLRSREKVLEAAKDYSEKRPALFLIDGDLYWVAGLSLPAPSHLFVHPCYCIENYLFCESAMIQIVVENNGVLSEEDACKALNWNAFCDQLERHLVPLFIEFAVAFSLCPEVKTFSYGISSILYSNRKNKTPTIDPNKVSVVRNTVRTEVLSKVTEKNYNKTFEMIAERVQVLPNPIDIVSGKDFLIPMQIFEANRIGGQKVTKKSFVFRLARHCSLDRLAVLRNKILDIIQLNKAIEATA